MPARRRYIALFGEKIEQDAESIMEYLATILAPYTMTYHEESNAAISVAYDATDDHEQIEEVIAHYLYSNTPVVSMVSEFVR